MLELDRTPRTPTYPLQTPTKTIAVGVESAAIPKAVRAKAATLGTIAKSTPPPLPGVARKKRFALLSSIRSCYIAEGKKKGLLLPTQYHRTSLCKHAMTGASVELWQGQDPARKDAKKGYFVGLQTCGSVWTCPVCANRIQEVRRLEIAQAMKYFYSKKKQAVMITFTFPHTASDSLKELLTKFSKALSAFKSSAPWEKFKKKHGFEGLIRSLEVTRGGNGWHPHTHELFFVNQEVDELAFKHWCVERWLAVCIRAGLVDANDIDKQEAFISHSLDFKFNCSTSDYLAKFDDNAHWGADREMAKASSKKGKNSGMHPFELAFMNYHQLFIEYTEAIKGKAQIFWSRGLKEKVGLKDIDDAEIAETETEEKEQDRFIGDLDKDAWYQVTSKELRADVLDKIEENKSIEKIRSFIFTASKNE